MSHKPIWPRRVRAATACPAAGSTPAEALTETVWVLTAAALTAAVTAAATAAGSEPEETCYTAPVPADTRAEPTSYLDPILTEDPAPASRYGKQVATMQ